MSDSLENMAEMQNEVTQPNEGVAPELEDNTPPQGDTEEMELVIEAEGDQTEEPKDGLDEEAKLRAAIIKKDRQRKEERDKRIALEKELAEVSSRVNAIEKGPRPSPYDFDSEEDFYSALDEWNGKGTKAQKQDDQPSQNQTFQNSVDEQVYLELSEEKLTKLVPDYAQQKSGLVEQFKQYGGGEQNISHLTSIAKERGIDVAKAFVGLNKNPSLVREINDAYAKQSYAALAEVLAKAEKKVRLQARKPIDTQPEPTIPNGGRIDNLQAAVEKAKDAWIKDGSIANYNAYKAAQKAAKAQ